jgi:hypothetical protein
MKLKHPKTPHPLTDVLMEAREFLIGELADVNHMIEFLNTRRRGAATVTTVAKPAPAKAKAKPAKSTKPPKRTFSPAAKKRMSAGMREYWAKRKAAKAAQAAKGKAKRPAKGKAAPKAPIAPPASVQPVQPTPHAHVYPGEPAASHLTD